MSALGVLDEESVAFCTFHSSLISEVPCFLLSDAQACLTALAPARSVAGGTLCSALGELRGSGGPRPIPLRVSPHPHCRPLEGGLGRGDPVVLPTLSPAGAFGPSQRLCSGTGTNRARGNITSRGTWTAHSVQGLFYWRLFRCCTKPRANSRYSV